jgi:inner membrane protein
MDNLTHSLVGLAAAKSGLERLSPGATALCILAANSPDADIVVLLFRDRWSFLQHHRGITHALVGTVVLSILLPVLFLASDFIISRIRKRRLQVRFVPLLIVSVLVTFTHPLLDWTNNYGIRPLLPWSAKWFYGDFIFIVDPFIWLILGSACFLLTTRTRFLRLVWLFLGVVLTLFIVFSPRGGGLGYPSGLRAIWLTTMLGLVLLFIKNVGDRLGSKLAMTSLVVVVAYWGVLMFAHSKAVGRAFEQATLVAAKDEKISRLAAMPTLANPFGWDCVFETDKATYRFHLTLGSEAHASRVVRYEKPTGTLDRVLKEVSEDRRTQIFLGFARFPVVKLSDEDCTSQTFLQLADLRYTEPGTSRGTFTLELPVDCSDTPTVNR